MKTKRQDANLCPDCGKFLPRGRKTHGPECKKKVAERVRRAWTEGKYENRTTTRFWAGRTGAQSANPTGKGGFQQRPQDAGRGPEPLSPEERKARRLSRALSRSSEVKLSPSRISKLRAEIAEAVSEQLVDAHKVVMGVDDKTWSPTQARVFGMLLNKVIPDLHASYVKKEDDDKPLNELSRDELERIVAGMEKIKADGARRPDPRSIPDAEIISEDDDEDGPEPPPGYFEEED